LGNRWTIEDGNTDPGKSDRYEWRLPENDNKHVEEALAPGDLLIKPSKITLKPTLSPKASGVQHGWEDWTKQTFTDSGTWYSYGTIIQED